MSRNRYWSLAERALKDNEPVVLVVVVEHHGSVPGKTGAMMIVTADAVEGTVGGGLVEHRLIERTRSEPENELFLFSHDGETSDSICSGGQTIAVIPLASRHLAAVELLADMEDRGAPGTLVVTPSGPYAEARTVDGPSFSGAPDDWRFEMPFGPRDTLTIIGGGHVGLALSRIMATLPFRIVVLDDRENLPTLENNSWAHEIHHVSWPEIARHVPEGPLSWVVIMTSGHRHDTEVLRNLLPLEVRYLGLMGSNAKVRQVFRTMEAEGFKRSQLAKVHAPIGLPIASHTPEEIAVSIAAEIIKVRNSEDPR